VTGRLAAFVLCDRDRLMSSRGALVQDNPICCQIGAQIILKPRMRSNHDSIIVREAAAPLFTTPSFQIIIHHTNEYHTKRRITVGFACSQPDRSKLKFSIDATLASWLCFCANWENLGPVATPNAKQRSSVLVLSGLFNSRLSRRSSHYR
jgi:hypothetical protein